MWQERHTQLVGDEIEIVLSPLAEEVKLYDLTKESLTRGRRGLTVKDLHARPWSLLPLLACEAICGCYERALPAAAALELFKAAADVPPENDTRYNIVRRGKQMVRKGYTEQIQNDIQALFQVEFDSLS